MKYRNVSNRPLLTNSDIFIKMFQIGENKARKIFTDRDDIINYAWSYANCRTVAKATKLILAYRKITGKNLNYYFTVAAKFMLRQHNTNDIPNTPNTLNTAL